MAFRIVAIGDSVIWGQGHLDQNKFTTQVFNDVLTRHGDASLEVLAHSGATIVPPADDGNPGHDGEVPFAAPSITLQANVIPDPNSVQLILMDGGINDVSVIEIVDPRTTPERLERETRQFCRDELRRLLILTATRCPNATLIVTGYYPILSHESVSDLLPAFLQCIGLRPHLTFGFDNPFLENPADNCVLFWQASNASIHQAVDSANQALGAVRAHFVSPGIDESMSAFTADPHVFAVGPGGLQDDKVAARALACPLAFNFFLHPIQLGICSVASVGHPNQQGANAYAAAIKDKLAQLGI